MLPLPAMGDGWTPWSAKTVLDLAYHRSIWQQKVTVFGRIPADAIIGLIAVNSDSLESVTARFLSQFGQFLLKLQTFRGADAAALERIQADAAEMARLLKGTPMLPKAMLNEWLMGIKMLRAEAPYVRGETDRIIKFADQLELLFGLVLLDECLEDLTPGVPRIN